MTNLECHTQHGQRHPDKNRHKTRLKLHNFFSLFFANIFIIFRVNTGPRPRCLAMTPGPLTTRPGPPRVTPEAGLPVFLFHRVEMISQKLVTPPMQVSGREMGRASTTTWTPPEKAKTPKSEEFSPRLPPTFFARGSFSIWHTHIHQKIRRNSLLRTRDYQFYKLTIGLSMQEGE